MIDEDRLADAMVAIGAAIEIPPGGPDRIVELAGTGGQARPSRPSWLRPPTLAAACLLLLVIAAGAIALGQGTSSVHASSAAGPLPAVPSTAAADAVGLSPPGAGGGATSAASTAGQASSAGSGRTAAPGTPPSVAPAPATAPAGPQVQTRVIKTGDVDIAVAKGQVSSTVNRLTTLAASLGGFVADSKSSESSTGPTGDVTVRVPANQFEALVTQVRALGSPVSSSTAGQDVTSQYVDLQARITSLQASRTQYLQIMQRAQAIGDVLAVQNQLDSLQAQIEQLQGQLNVLSNQTSYSTLAVHVSDDSTNPVPVATKRPTGLSKAWAHTRHSFARGLESIVAALGGIAVFLLAAAAIALIGRGLWEVIRRRLV